MQVLKPEMKKQINTAALEVFFEKGFRDASMKEIASRAEMSVSNMYNYYHSKQDLFSSLVSPVRTRIFQVLDALVEGEEDHSIAEDSFRPVFEDMLTKKLMELFNFDRKVLILLFDRSIGTPFENTREEMVERIQLHFTESLPASERDPETELLMHIFAANLLEGLLEIVRHYRGKAQAEKLLQGLIHYHINGIFPFFK